jgi:hypothetical protein
MFCREIFGLAFAAALAVAYLFFSTDASAQSSQITTASVMAGKETTIFESLSRIEIKTKPVKGSAQVAVSTTDPKIYRLLYTANTAADRTTDELTYAKEGDPALTTLKIDVAPPAPEFTDKAYQESFKAIFLLLVLAVVLESALAVIFNWRPFVETFNARAVRPLFSFVVALVFVNLFNLDIVTSLVNAATTEQFPVSTAGLVLTALVIAGGSSGVNTLLVGLGYRQIKTPETMAPKPPPQKGWIAVKIARERVVGTVGVFIGAPATIQIPDGAGGAHTIIEPPAVGTIAGTSSKNLFHYFLRDLGRFPGYGGFEVTAGQQCAVKVKGTDANNNPVEHSWGPHVVAGGAIIDLEFHI